MLALPAHLLSSSTLKQGAPCDRQGVANIAWAFAKARIKHEALMLGLGDCILREDFLQQCSAQTISNVAWAWARLELHIQGGCQISTNFLLPLPTPNGPPLFRLPKRTSGWGLFV